MSTIERKLATIVSIDSLHPIEGADRIERAVVKGWDVVVKRGEFAVGDLAVYFEIDSWIPSTIAPFLTAPGKYAKEFNGVEGEKLKTKKLKGVISQGLLLPLSVLGHEGIGSGYFVKCGDTPIVINKEVGADCTEFLGIQKWEKPIPAALRGQVKGYFPTHLVPRTDQDRIQNVAAKILENIKSGMCGWAVQEKLDGSSCTILVDETGEFTVCSRNLALKREENNAFWKAAMVYESAICELVANGEWLAFQGELISSNIQGNPYKLKEGEFQFRLFDVYDINAKSYVSSDRMYEIAERLGMLAVPKLIGFFADGTEFSDPRELSDYLLSIADGKSCLADVDREGLVFKSNDNPNITFKVISNKWLLKEKD